MRVVNQTLIGLGLEKQPEKTFIGRIEKGFDFLGYHLRPAGLRVAQATLDTFVARATQLYEQGPGGGLASARLGFTLIPLLWIWGDSDALHIPVSIIGHHSSATIYVVHLLR